MTATQTSQAGQVAVIGLGIMGAAFARHLREAGYEVTGYDPDTERRRLAGGFGIGAAASAEAAIAGASFVLCSLPSADALAQTAEAAERAPTAPAVVVELSTLDLGCKLEARRRFAALGHALLDCPVSGTGAQAEAGEVVVYASGAVKPFEVAKPVLECLGGDIFYLGDFGNGSRMKLIANLLVAVHNAAAAEAVALAERAGIDPGLFLEVVGAGGAAGSRVLELRGPMMVDRRYEPATMRLDLWQKDLKLIGELARSVAAPTPLFDSSLPLYAAALERGLGKADTAAICEVLRSMEAGDVD